MGTEYQDLSIRVNLPDIANASSMIGKLKSELRDLGGGSIRELLDKLRTQTKDLGKGFEEFADKGQDAAAAAIGLSRSVAIAGTAGVIFGAAIVGAAAKLVFFSTKMIDLGRIARETGGITTLQLKSMTDQLNKMNIAPEVLTRSIEGLRSKLADLALINSQVRRQLLAGATPGKQEEMLAWAQRLAELVKTDRLAEALNEIADAQKRVHDNAMATGRGQIYANEQARKFLDTLGIVDRDLRRFWERGGRFAIVPPEEAARMEKLVDSFERVNKVIGTIKTNAIIIADRLAGSALERLLAEDGTIVSGLESMAKYSEKFAEALKDWKWPSIPEAWRWLLEKFGLGGATASPTSFGGVPGAGGPIVMPASFRGGYGGAHGGARVIPASYGGGGGGYGGGYGGMYGGGPAIGGGPMRGGGLAVPGPGRAGGGVGGGGGGYTRLPSGPGGIPMPGGGGASAGGFGVPEGILPPNLGGALGAGLPGAAAPSGGGGGGGAFESIFRGTPLSGQYGAIAAAAQKYGIPPDLAAAVMAHETGRGTSAMLRNQLNPGGIMDPETGMAKGKTYGSLGEGIDDAVRVMANNWRKGGETIEGMGARYAPVGAANDPRGLNSGWAAGVGGFRQQLSAGGGTGALGPSEALAFARQHLGNDEIRDESKLRSFFSSQGINVSPRTTAWCAAFVNANLEKAGIKGTGSLAAGSFTRFGTAVKPGEVLPGDIGVVRGTSSRTGLEGSHVGFLTGESREGEGGLEYQMLGGNQPGTVSGRGGVSEKWYPASRLHLRRPPGSKDRPSDWTRQEAKAWPGAGDDQDVRSSKYLDRKELDRAMGREITSKVEGTGQIDVNVRAPRGTSVTAKSGGIFKRSAVNRQTQMEPTRSGPPEPVSGVGSREIPI